MKYFLALILVVGQLLSAARAAEPQLANGIAVIVNDAVITFKDVQNVIRDDIDAMELRYASQPQVLEQKIREMQTERIEELVEYQLVLQEFKTAGYVVPESYIQNRINEDIKKYAGDRLRLTKTLQAQGTTYESYRTKIRERAILELMWRQKLPPDPLISPAKIEKYYLDNKDKFQLGDEVKLRIIVLTNRPNDKAFSPKKLAGEVAKKIDEGASFADMAKIYSNGSQAAQGGDWGWVEKKVLRDELAAVAFTLKPGKRSDVIETASACYLMLVEESRPAHVRTLAEVRDEVEATLKAQENKRLRKQWIERLKQKSFVRYF